MKKPREPNTSLTLTYSQESDGNRVEQTMAIGKIDSSNGLEAIRRFQEFAESLKEWVLEMKK